MKTTKKHSIKQRGLRTLIVLSGLVFTYAVTIPTNLGNAVQYLAQTIWTDDGTDSGIVNVAIDDTNIYVRTGFLSDGTGWNSKALGVDSSGNVVYVNANGNINNPLNLPQAHYIPKINAAGDDLEVSKLFQSGTMVGVNTLNPLKTLDVLGDFQVMTVGQSLTYQYQLFQTSTTSNTLAILLQQTAVCDCDPNNTPDLNTQVDCSAPFVATPSDPGFCIDITSQDPNNSNQYFYTMYEKIGTGVAEPVLVTNGNHVGIGTSTPNQNYDLHVGGNGGLLVDSYLTIGDVSTTPNVSNATLSFPNPTGPLMIRAQTNNPPGLPRNIGINPGCFFNQNINNWMCFFGVGNVGIGTNDPGVGSNNPIKLDVVGNIRYVNAYALSDENLKENITNISDGIMKITSLQGISYRWKNSGEDAFNECEQSEGGYICDEEIIPFPEGTQMGFSAQDIEDILPDLVDTDGNGLKSVNYNGLVPVLVEAIKEQQALINDLTARIEILEG